MGSPGVVEGTQTMKILLAGAFLAGLLQPPRPHLRPLPLPRLLLTPGMGTTVMDTGLMATTGLMAMDTTTERGLLMLSLLLMLLLPLRLMLMPGMDTGLMATTGLMAMDTTMERGLPMLSPLLMLLLPPRLRLIPGMDTTVMDTGLMAMDTMDTGLMAMDTTMERGLLMLRLKLLLLPLTLMPGMDTMAMVCTDLMAMDTMDTGPMVITGERSKKPDSCQTAAN